MDFLKKLKEELISQIEKAEDEALLNALYKLLTFSQTLDANKTMNTAKISKIIQTMTYLSGIMRTYLREKGHIYYTKDSNNSFDYRFYNTKRNITDTMSMVFPTDSKELQLTVYWYNIRGSSSVGFRVYVQEGELWLKEENREPKHFNAATFYYLDVLLGCLNAFIAQEDL